MKIVNVGIGAITSNPFRRLHSYPYIESKIEALQRSIKDVGLWPSVMARSRPDGLYELAFGHHRVEAARRSSLEKIPVIVADLSDTEMLQYMGRENLEDYNAVFIIQLEAWEATLKSGLCPGAPGQAPEPIEIAKLLGWTDIHSERGVPQLNDTARACHAVYSLVIGGHLARENFVELSVKAAGQIAERTVTNLEWLKSTAKGSGYTTVDNQAAQEHVVQGARDTADQVRAGSVPSNTVRSRVDFNAGVHAAKSQRPSPLFAKFAKDVAEKLRKTIATDSSAEKMQQIEVVLSQISLIEDWEALGRLKLELQNLGKRTEAWDKRLTPTKEKVVQLRALEKAQ